MPPLSPSDNKDNKDQHPWKQSAVFFLPFFFSFFKVAAKLCVFSMFGQFGSVPVLEGSRLILARVNTPHLPFLNHDTDEINKLK